MGQQQPRTSVREGELNEQVDRYTLVPLCFVFFFFLAGSSIITILHRGDHNSTYFLKTTQKNHRHFLNLASYLNKYEVDLRPQGVLAVLSVTSKCLDRNEPIYNNKHTTGSAPYIF
jgi:hypothetical protein